MKKCVVFVLILALFVQTGLAERYEFDGAADAEGAVRAYVEAFAAGDLAGMLSNFAIESYADNFDLKAQIARLQSCMLAQQMHSLGEGEFFRAANVETRRSKVYEGIWRQVMSLCAPEMDITIREIFTGEEGSAQIDAFLAQIAEAEAKFARMQPEIVGFEDPMEVNEYIASERMQQNLSAFATICGGDEIRPMVARLQMGGTEYLLLCDAVRYGEKWYLHSLSGTLGNLMGVSFIAGGLIPIEEVELP